MPEEKTEKSEEKTAKPQKSGKLGLVLGFVVVAVVFFAAGYFGNGSLGGFATGAVTSDQAGAKAVAYINDYLLPPGIEATLTSVTEENGIYQVNITISSPEGSMDYQSYVTKDGKLLFVSGVDLDVTPEVPEEPEAPEPKGCDDITKSDTPVLEAFVVSYCPFGIQTQRMLAELASDFGGNIVVRYLGAVQDGQVVAMHGETEAAENLKQICIREETDKYWSYISCFIKSGDTDSCVAEAGIDTAELEACMTDPERGVAYASVDFGLQSQYQVTGSPALILNGERVSEFDFGGRTAEAAKSLLCCGFNTQSDACLKEFATDQAARGFSPTYSGSGSAGPASSCG